MKECCSVTMSISGELDANRPVPFRLTPNIADFLTATGVTGPLTAAMVASARCFVQPQYKLASFLRAILRDEYITWHKKVLKRCKPVLGVELNPRYCSTLVLPSHQHHIKVVGGQCRDYAHYTFKYFQFSRVGAGSIITCYVPFIRNKKRTTLGLNQLTWREIYSYRWLTKPSVPSWPGCKVRRCFVSLSVYSHNFVIVFLYKCALFLLTCLWTESTSGNSTLCWSGCTGCLGNNLPPPCGNCEGFSSPHPTSIVGCWVLQCSAAMIDFFAPHCWGTGHRIFPVYCYIVCWNNTFLRVQDSLCGFLPKGENIVCRNSHAWILYWFCIKNSTTNYPQKTHS